ncbi:MAG: Hint domain-containing protein [Rhodobacteraceae bacterium]|nr:MAG: Hint domain-containing protein [Paracoccaceae bacterium]
MDPGNPPSRWTSLTVARFDLVDNNDDGDIDRFNGDSVDGIDVTRSYPGDTVRVWVPGQGYVTYTGTTFYLADGREVFTPTDGGILQDGLFYSSTWVTTQGPLDVGDLGPVCFTPGTQIETDQGLRPIETLRPGERVRTRDNGFQVLRWIGMQEAEAEADFAPVVFQTGVLGNPAPLCVSQQHRVLVTGWRAELFAGEDEVLVAAKHLVNGRDVVLRPGGRVTYVHILFDGHEIVRAGGVWSESYFPGHAAERRDDGLRAELRALFPDLEATARGMTAARRVAKRHEAACLVA